LEMIITFMNDCNKSYSVLNQKNNTRSSPHVSATDERIGYLAVGHGIFVRTFLYVVLS